MRYYPGVIRRSGAAALPEPETTNEAAQQQQGPGITAIVSPNDVAVSGADAGEGNLNVGAQVGSNRNLEFSAGGRSHRVSTGSYTKA